MPRGSRPGERRGGRKKGTLNKRTKEREAAVTAAAEKLAEAIPEIFKGDAHAFLMSIYKDPEVPREQRLDAAKAAVRYETPALSSVDRTGEAVKQAVVRIPPKSANPDEWQHHYAPSQSRN